MSHIPKIDPRGSVLTRGKFIVLDGIDGAGTTTHCKLLEEWLESIDKEVLLTQEPTEGKIGTLIRQYLRRDSESNDPLVDALLFAADRQEHQTLIQTALEEGKVVVSDRYLESSLCYQGLQLDGEFVLLINKHAIKPDITIILDISAEISCQRKTMTEKFEKLEILKKVRACFLERAKKENYLVVSTAENINLAQKKIQDFLSSRLS